MRIPPLMLGLVMLALGGSARQIWAQADKPPELEGKPGPSTLPAVVPSQPPAHGTLTLTFSGTSSFSNDELKEAIKRQVSDIEEGGLDDASAYDAAFFTETFYHKHGFPKAEVASHINGPWSLTLQVKEGPRTKVGTVTIRGNKVHDEKTLTDFLLGPTRERYPEIKVDTMLPFVEADVNNGVDLVRRLYASDGYLEAVVNPPTFKLSGDMGSAAIGLVIHEGIQYHFGKATFDGALLVDAVVLRAEINEDLAQPYTEGRLAAAQRKLVDFYKKCGYFAAKVDARADKQTRHGQMAVIFTVTSGPLYHFDGITTQGLQRVKPSFLEARFKSLNGQIYDPDLIDKKFREAIGTGLFKNLRITPTPVEGDRLRLDITADEAKAKEVGFSAGFSSFEGGIFGVTYSDRNWFGSGRPLTLSAEINGLGYKGEFLYQDPWLFDSEHTSLKLRAYALTQEVQGYSKIEYGFQPTLTEKLSDHWEVSAFVLAKHVELDSFEIKPDSLVGPPEYFMTTAGLTQKVDYRNNKLNPTKGWYFVTTFDGALNGGGSDVSFVRGTYRLSAYFPVTSKTTLALGASGGIISAKGGPEALPIDERFFNGGATSVRSFRERELGPTDIQGLPIGGEAFTNFNIEYTFPLYGDLKGAVFADAGNLMFDAKDFGFNNMRYAVGVGVRYNLPVGPIRVDFGVNPSPKKGEDRAVVQFSIGVAF